MCHVKKFLKIHQNTYNYVITSTGILLFLAPPNDDLRLDIVLPGERCIYIWAASREERQRWLVALGNSRRDNPQHGGMNTN